MYSPHWELLFEIANFKVQTHRVEAAIFEDKSMAPYQAGLDRMGEPPQVYYVTEDGLVVGAYGEDLSFIFTVEGLELVGVRHAEDTTFSLIS